MADTIDYPALVKEALTGMVRRLLAQAAEEGLPGEHHFYLGFRTDAPGVEIPAFLRQQHPREMTIVLQHQFWGLEAGDDGFSVKLRFSGTPARVVVPWKALTAFADPSVPFGLRLAAEPEASPAEDAAPAAATDAPATAEATPETATPAPTPGEPAPSRNVVAFRRRPPSE